jgi:arylsulfatase A-like enzyme
MLHALFLSLHQTMNLLLFCLLCLALLLSSNSSSHAATSPKPNVVILLADDLGWSDISHHPGGSIKTPNIDRLFKQGVELRQFMGWCVCSPTRAMLLTSRHPFRVGTGPEVNGELAKEETTLAEAFKANGYKTGVFGKWHNGEDPDTPEFHRAFDEAWKAEPQRKYVATGIGVNEHGFDEAWIYYGGGPDYFTRRAPKTNAGPPRWWHNREHRPQDTGYTQDLITQHATEFIREHRSEPFFCYVPFQIVHEPYQAKESDLAKVDVSITDPTARSYAAMVQVLDQSVADILAELDKNGLRENTIVVFSSDNGATKAGCNLPLRGGKHSLFEGGIRLPTAIHWPNGGLTGGTPWDGFCGALDLFPTLISMIDGEMPKTRPLDGKDLWPALKTRGQSPVESYYFVWHGQDVLRTPQWKLHRGMERFELYDVQSDESETTNVAATHPDVVKVLTAKMDAWVDSLGAALSHRPAPLKYHAVPAAEGDVLEVTVIVTPKATAQDQLVIPIAT